MHIGGELGGDDAAAPGVTHHAPHEGLLHVRLAGGTPGRLHVGAVAHEQRDALLACTPGWAQIVTTDVYPLGRNFCIRPKLHCEPTTRTATITYGSQM